MRTMGAALRVIAGIFFLLAAVALAADLTRYVNGSGFTMTSLASHWRGFSPVMLKSAQQLVSSTVHPVLWDPIIWRLISLPAWFLFGAIGLTFAYLGRVKRRVNIFIN
jgi:hypothetical protein